MRKVFVDTLLTHDIMHRNNMRLKLLNSMIFGLMSIFSVSCADLNSDLNAESKVYGKDLAHQERVEASDQTEFCKAEKIKQLAKDDAQDFKAKKSKSNFDVCGGQNFYSVYLNEYSKSLKTACSSQSVLSKKGSDFAKKNHSIEEGTDFIKAGCPKNLVKSASKIFTLSYLSAATVHSYKNSVESQGRLSPKEEALLVEKIKIENQVKQSKFDKFVFQKKIQDLLPNLIRNQKYR